MAEIFFFNMSNACSSAVTQKCFLRFYVNIIILYSFIGVLELLLIFSDKDDLE